MRSGGYIPIPMAPSIFVKISTSGICIVAINTDDGIVLGSTQSQVDEFRDFYNSKYEVKWGAITRYGGVNITEHDDGSLTLSTRRTLSRRYGRNGRVACLPMRRAVPMGMRRLTCQ
eukprot:scaffold48476_cov60-Phaeocystis_antarctica.AAC.1